MSFARVLGEAARDLATDRDLESALDRVVELSMRVDLCDHAGVTLLMPGGRYQTAAPTDDRVQQADALQYELNEGPCVDALWADGLYTVEDTATDRRWPNWGPRAAELGMHSILSVHLFTDRAPIGAMNLYSGRHREYTEVEVARARAISAHTSALGARFRTLDDLWRAIDTRHLIGQAQGMVRAKSGVSADEALLLLNRYSQRTNLKLRAVAEQIIRTGELPVGIMAAGGLTATG